MTLPAGTTAVGCDLWTQQPYVGTIEVTAATADGREHTVVVNTFNRPAAAFVGFVSEAEIVAVSFRPPRGQVGLFLDNFTYGRRAEGRTLRPTAAASPPGGAGPQSGLPPAPPAGQALDPGAVQAAIAAAGRQPAQAAGQTPQQVAGQTPTPEAGATRHPH